MSTEAELELSPRHLSLKELEAMCRRGCEGKDFIGVVEENYVDFKSKPYLDDEESKIELVKDVTAIANAGGGLIIIGPKTEKRDKEKRDWVKSINPVAEELIRMDSWTDVLCKGDRVVPRFSASLVNSGFCGAGKELFWLRIKATPALDRPFVITKDWWGKTQDGRRIKGAIFGCYTRDGAENVDLFSAETIQRYIAAGMRKGGSDTQEQLVQDVLGELRELRSVVANIPRPQVPQENDSLEDFLGIAEERIDLSKGYTYLYAVPHKPGDIQDFWDKDKNAYKLIDEPPSLRSGGWDLRTAFSEHPIAARNWWETMNGDRKYIALSRSGELFSASSVSEFLDWGIDRYQQQVPAGNNTILLNSFALTEYVDTFCHAMEVLKGILGDSTGYRMIFGVKPPKGSVYSLLRPIEVGMFFRDVVGRSDGGQIRIEVPVEESIPQEVAGRLMIEIYASLFAHTDDKAYLVQNEQGKLMVDETKFPKIGA